MAAMVLRLKTKTGPLVLRDLNNQHTVSDLRRELCNLCKISDSALNVLSGFPPKQLDLGNTSLSLEQAGINSGDTLIVEEKAQAVPSSDAAPPASVPVEMDQWTNGAPKGVILRKVVPADNSCLFTSVGFVLSGKIDTTCGGYMRALIVEHVKGDPETFSEAILGKPPGEYCSWILNPDAWGGAIELAILSKYYGIEIAVVDSQNGIVNRFGEDLSHPHRVLLIFDGIHYDPLYLENVQTGATQTIFPADDAEVLAEAQQLAEESKSSKQYTDVQKFTIKCLDCKVQLVGQMAASDHAKRTGHVNFGEIV